MEIYTFKFHRRAEFYCFIYLQFFLFINSKRNREVTEGASDKNSYPKCYDKVLKNWSNFACAQGSRDFPVNYFKINHLHSKSVANSNINLKNALIIKN